MSGPSQTADAEPTADAKALLIAAQDGREQEAYDALALVIDSLGGDLDPNTSTFRTWYERYSDVASAVVRRLQQGVEEKARLLEREAARLRLVNEALSLIGVNLVGHLSVTDSSTKGSSSGDNGAPARERVISQRAIRTCQVAATTLHKATGISISELSWTIVTPPDLRLETAARMWGRLIKVLVQGIKGNMPTRRKRLRERWEATFQALAVSTPRPLTVADMEVLIRTFRKATPADALARGAKKKKKPLTEEPPEP
ncbi:hypothetical protein B0A53_04858 [Rhodotorula sp. CCFEE 5036]|nr:hypothetical protein B0A53_04858 [Rhodotorula sp. CCFEE 5036]